MRDDQGAYRKYADYCSTVGVQPMAFDDWLSQRGAMTLPDSSSARPIPMSNHGMSR